MDLCSSSHRAGQTPLTTGFGSCQDQNYCTNTTLPLTHPIHPVCVCVCVCVPHLRSMTVCAKLPIELSGRECKGQQSLSPMNTLSLSAGTTAETQ